MSKRKITTFFQKKTTEDLESDNYRDGQEPPAKSPRAGTPFSDCSEGEKSHSESDDEGTRGDIGLVVAKADNSFDKLRGISGRMEGKEKLALLRNHVVPSTSEPLRSHTVTKSGKTWTVSFQRQWLTNFPWLAYSRHLDGGLCKSCVLFPNFPERGGGRGSSPGVLVLQPFEKMFTKALGKDGILPCHEKSSMHKFSQQQADMFVHNQKNPDHRADSLLLSKGIQNERENKVVLRQLVVAVELLGKQSLPFRGHRDDKVDFENLISNKGNFVAVLNALSKNSEILRAHLLRSAKNGKYTSKTIQNEIISIYACEVRKKISEQIRENNLPYTIIADEATDPHANQEILSISVRFVDLTLPDDPHIREFFLCFVHLERATADAISQKILKALGDPDVALDVKKIRGQAYDGAAAMSSAIRGVQAKIKEVSPLAVYTHCYCHCLNLSIAESCKISEVREIFDLINTVYSFLSNSPKRQKFFERVIKCFSSGSTHSRLLGLCKTRWAERHTCFEVFLELYGTVVIFLDAIVSPQDYPELSSDSETTLADEWKWDCETRKKTQGLRASLSLFATIATFVITKNVLDELRSIASKLQKRDQDICQAYAMIDTVKETVKGKRTNIDDVIDIWYTQITALATSLGVTEAVRRKVAVQQHRSNQPSKDAKQHYKRTIAIPLLDSLLQQLERRFPEGDRHALGLFKLVPEIAVHEKTVACDGTIQLLMQWASDLPCPASLQNELSRWEELWKRTADKKTVRLPSNLLEALGACDHDAFPNLHVLLITGCTLPISSAEAERSFSLLKRIKTYTRSTMGETRMSDLACIAMNYETHIPVDHVCQSFVQRHPRKLFAPSLFDL